MRRSHAGQNSDPYETGEFVCCWIASSTPPAALIIFILLVAAAFVDSNWNVGLVMFGRSVERTC